MSVDHEQHLSRRAILAAGLALPPALAAIVARAQPPPAGGMPSIRSALPIPATAKGPAIPPDKGYLVEEIRGGVYWVTDGGFQAMFVTTSEGVIAVDAPQSIGQKFLKAIAEVTDRAVKWLIYSHSHTDHIGAATVFPRDVTVIAHRDVADKLARLADPMRPVPTVTFSDTYTLDVGGQMLVLEYPGPNHEPGNSFIYAPRQKVMMAVDIVFPGWVPFRSLAVSHDIPGWVAAHDQLLRYDFDTLVAGHLTRLGTPEDVRVQREYILDLKANATQALQAVDFAAIAGQTGAENLWLLFDVYLETVAQATAQATLAKWSGRLGGADVFTLSHARAMEQAVRIDFV